MHLRAELPSARRAAARGQMDLRIARKVAVLSGISDDLGGSPDDTDQPGAWYSDYRLLTTTELSLGGPLRANDAVPEGIQDAGVFRRAGGEAVDLRGDSAAKPLPIPSVTLNLYGPDTKAALILTGVNKLLENVHQAVQRALEDIRWQVDDEFLLVAVAQCLLQEVFESQPLLLLHGIQAGLIQRALRISDVVRHRGHGAPEIARLEYGWPRPSSEKHVTTDHIDITSAVWDQLIDKDEPVYLADRKRVGSRRFPEPCLRFRTQEGYEQEQDFSSDNRADLRMRWVATLRDLTESHLGGITPGVPQTSVLIDRARSNHQLIEASIPRERQIELLLARIAPHLAPLLLPDQGEAATTGADPSTDELRRIGLPVIHAAYWRNCTVVQRRAVLLAHYYAIRAAGWIAGMKALNRKRDRAECTRRYLDLVDAAEQLLDQDDPLLLQLSTYGRTYGLVYDSCRGSISRTAYRRVIQDARKLVELTGESRYSRPKLLETLQNALVGLTTVSFAAAHFDPRAERMSRGEMVADLESLWAEARDIRAELGGGPPEQDPGFEHDYALYLVSDPHNEANLLRGIEILRDSVIPLRTKVADRDGLRRGLRLSEQVYLRGLSNALANDHGTAEQRVEWARAAMEKADLLEGSRDVRQVRAWLNGPAAKIGDRFDNSMLILLIRIADGRVSALCNGGLDGHRDEAGAAVDTLTAYVKACEVDSQIDTLRLDQVSDIKDRYGRWAGNK